MIARAVLIAALLAAGPALAQPRIEIAPIRLDLSAEKAIGSLRLRNTSDGPVAFEVEALAWTQNNGEDVLNPTDSAVVSPPAFVIAPHGEQIVRVGVRGAKRNDEQTFRLLFTEKVLNQDSEETTLRLRLQMSLPVFVSPSGGQAGDGLAVEFARNGADETMRVSNISNRHVVIAESLAGDRKVALPRYLLAGQSVERPVQAGAAPISLALLQNDSIVRKEYRVAPDSNRSPAAR